MIILLYPVLTASRNLIDLGGIWDFKLDDGTGFEKEWFAAPLRDAISMPVPASYNDLKEGCDHRDHYGWVFYQRPLSIPACLLQERLVLRCAAVTHIAKVYLNNALLCEHKGGFLPFEVELGAAAKPGENLLTIAVDNRIDYSTLPVGSENGTSMLGGISGMIADMPKGKPRNEPFFDFFNYCGITRPVKLYTTPKSYIADISLVSKVDGTRAEIAYQVDTVGEGAIAVSVFDDDGRLVAQAQGGEGILAIPDVKLWQPMDAYLYQIHVSFGADVYALPYGVRTVEVKGTEFLINGKPFYFKGYGKHEDTFPNGRGINEPMNVKDISLMKWQGANSFRTSHYPYSEEMMRLCDREGIVVIDETPAVGINLTFGGGANFSSKVSTTFDAIRTHEHHREVIRDMIARDKNHACVVMWSIANEPDSTGKGAYEYFAPLFALARELDPCKRPCTLVSVQSVNFKEDCTIKLSDVICLNRYYGWYALGGDLETAEVVLRKELEFWGTLGKPVMFTEYGADTVMGMHDTTPVMFTEEYQSDYYAMNHKVFDEMPFFVGEQVWNFADFATIQGIMRVQGNKKGLFTRDRKPKLAAHTIRARWSAIPDFNYKK